MQRGVEAGVEAGVQGAGRCAGMQVHGGAAEGDTVRREAVTWTLTTTSSPVLRVARCTCAREAAAIGSRSKDAKSSSGVLPSSCLISAIARSTGKPGTSFCSRVSLQQEGFERPAF